jgi:hypothetical protein
MKKIKFLKKTTKKYLDINKELNHSMYFKEDKIHMNSLGYNKLNIKIKTFITI